MGIQKFSNATPHGLRRDTVPRPAMLVETVTMPSRPASCVVFDDRSQKQKPAGACIYIYTHSHTIQYVIKEILNSAQDSKLPVLEPPKSLNIGTISSKSPTCLGDGLVLSSDGLRPGIQELRLHTRLPQPAHNGLRHLHVGSADQNRSAVALVVQHNLLGRAEEKEYHK